MNPQQEAVALWQFLEARGVTPTVRGIARILRQEYGLKFRNGDLAVWVTHFRGAPGDHPGSSIRARGEQSGRTRGAPSREKEVSLSLTSVPDGTPVSDETVPLLLPNVPAREETAVPSERRRTPRQGSLGLDKAETIAAAELCETIWKLIGGVPGTVKSGWKVRNMRTARELVQAGVTPAQLVTVAEEFNALRGYHARRIDWLQEFMGRVEGRPKIDDAQSWVDSLPCAYEVAHA